MAAIFYIIWQKDLVETQGLEWLMSLLHRSGYLGAERSSFCHFSATCLIQGTHPSLCPIVTAYQARYQFSGPSPLSVLPTAGGGGPALKVEVDRERGAQDDWGEGQPGTQGAGIWLAAWLLMPSPEKVAELRGKDAVALSPPGSRSCCGNPAPRPKTPSISFLGGTCWLHRRLTP